MKLEVVSQSLRALRGDARINAVRPTHLKPFCILTLLLNLLLHLRKCYLKILHLKKLLLYLKEQMIHLHLKIIFLRKLLLHFMIFILLIHSLHIFHLRMRLNLSLIVLSPSQQKPSSHKHSQEIKISILIFIRNVLKKELISSEHLEADSNSSFLQRSQVCLESPSQSFII